MDRTRRVNKIRIFIIEDSRLYQTYLRKIIESDAYLEVAGIAGSKEEALQMIGRCDIDLITLDLNLPDSNEYELLQELMIKTKIPIIVVTSNPSACEQAIRLGAKDFVEKIQTTGKYSSEQFAILLKLKLKTQGRLLHKEVERKIPPVYEAKQDERLKKQLTKKTEKDKLIVLGASLGGTEVTMDILKDLPTDTPGMVVVQHMPVGFTNAYAMRLDKNCKVHVKEATSGELVKNGEVLIAKGGEQILVYPSEEGIRVKLAQEKKRNGFAPSVDVLFESASALRNVSITGIILTGMGRDGALGMKSLHDHGAYTIGQTEESCAVYGMPRAAKELGAIDQELNPKEIAKKIMKIYG